MTKRILVHPVLKDQVTVIISAEESGGDLFRFEYLARSVTPAPHDHAHRCQEERIEILEGKLHCRIAGSECVLSAGETIVIPPGTPHAVWNAQAAGCRALGEYRPALDAQAMLEAEFAEDERTLAL